MNIISISNLAKYLNGAHVLRGIDLEIAKGEIMALVGPSGSGKSTLLKCLNRLMDIDKGEILFDGVNITTMPPIALRRSMVLVQQESVMFPGTVYDNVAFGLALQGPVDDEHLKQCISDVSLSPAFLHRSASMLSGGEKQRVALARALALRPTVLLLDEPTAGIDPKNVQKVEQLIIEFSQTRELTVVWVTHDVAQARRVSDRTASLRDGRVFEVTNTPLFQWEGVY
jgi:ABC-type phosphate transport system ATPase subunit